MAIESLKALADTKCPDWPEWEKYIWHTLATWEYETEKNILLSCHYWKKATTASPDRECAYQTNVVTINDDLQPDEKKSVLEKYAYANGCKACNECYNYNTEKRCCPKAQYQLAKQFVKDKNVSRCLIEEAAKQGYVRAIEYLSIDELIRNSESIIEVSHKDDILFSSGTLPDVIKTNMVLFRKSNKSLLITAANHGSRKAAALLFELSNESDLFYESIYYAAILKRKYDVYNKLNRLFQRNLNGGKLKSTTLLENDIITIADILVKNDNKAKNDIPLLKHLAEHYIKSKEYGKALELYKMATVKDETIIKRIEYLKQKILNESMYECNEHYNTDMENYEEMTWDALTDGMYGDYPGSGIDYDGLGF